ncbi:hypothetical protein [Rubrivivax albus]|uniref:Uncharacterized protein n=1 Tax=Rubrivivax albus TaxID=2499835 RepID=A0A437JJQ9_9BURK|nr:hypothetical protein [Rubrivivax albus]RVT46846.1 hypothetical protein ENE75_24500 [Rubrivivax albus]
MKLVFLAVTVVLQAAVAAWFVSKYFAVTGRIARLKGWRWRAIEWVLFGIFVLIVIPIGAFFPIWFYSILPGDAADRDWRLVLIIVGWVSLIASVGFGWLHSRNEGRGVHIG